ncbi:MAG: ABC transporter substrate-binding protein [Desulfonauticus sp.]|nr:ABC transporter substrate-binding protein [Desulfonauticus sp.]
MKRYLSISLLLLLCLLTISCSQNKKEKANTLKIGAILRLSKGASDGIPAKYGIEIAVAEINQHGGINGKKVKVIFYDSKDDSTTAVNAAQKLITVDKVQAIIGPMMSGNVLAVAPICNKSKVVLLTPTGTSPKISTAGPYVFRICSRIDVQAKALVKKAIALTGKTNPTVAIIYSNEPYGKGCKNLFLKFLQKNNITPVAIESFQRGDKDFQAQLTKLIPSNPDILFIPGYLQETAPLIVQARQMGLTGLSVGGFGDIAPQYITLAKQAAEGHLVAGEYDPDYATQLNKKFVRLYKQKLAQNPDAPNNIMFAALTYDGVRMIADAFKHGANTGEEVKNFLIKLKNFDGVTGRLSFDQNGDVQKGGVYLFQVKNGKYVKIN